MKLLNKLSIRYLFFALITLVLTGGLLYIILSMVINEEMDEKLQISYKRIKNDIEKNKKFYSLKPFTDVHRVKSQKEYRHFKNKKIKIDKSKHAEEFRQLTVVKKINGKYYKIIIRESKFELNELLKSFSWVIFGGFLLLVFSLILINRHIAKTIWNPFYKNLEMLKKFSLNELKPLSILSTDIHEFKELNRVLSKFTDKAIIDYQNLKQFSEDASHEIQTPLAIIKSKIETLLDNNNFSEQQTEGLNSIYHSVHRLSRLNKDLLLLAKIDNKQFEDSEKISFNEIIINKLAEFQELIRLKNISLNTEFNHEILFNINAFIAEILINNMISNGIKHNLEGGELKIAIDDKQIHFYNSGTEAIKNPESLFNRFYKENSESKSVGLGLAIVKKICDLNGIKYRYSFTQNLHCFSLIFEL